MNVKKITNCYKSNLHSALDIVKMLRVRASKFKFHGGFSILQHNIKNILYLNNHQSWKFNYFC